MFNFSLTCQSGLESLVRRESEKLGLEKTSGQDRLVEGTGDMSTMMRLCMGSRFANRVYLKLAEAKVTDFDALFDLASSIDWKQYISPRLTVVIDASSTRSELTSTPTIQSITEKAIEKKLSNFSGKDEIEIHILVLIIDDIARILLDITGDALHKRGYRGEQGDAPIKETLAAALVAFSGWKYREPLLDPFCGSGTIAIEAALMARGIAPGLDRHFRFEDLPLYEREPHSKLRKELKEREFSGTYQIYASDIDPTMIDIAKRNAMRAGVLDSIVFERRDFLDETCNSKHATGNCLVTNPPYGNRLEQDNLGVIYEKLVKDISTNGGGFITSYDIGNAHTLANRKLLNGSEECRFWYRKN